MLSTGLWCRRLRCTTAGGRRGEKVVGHARAGKTTTKRVVVLWMTVTTTTTWTPEMAFLVASGGVLRSRRRRLRCEGRPARKSPLLPGKTISSPSGRRAGVEAGPLGAEGGLLQGVGHSEGEEVVVAQGDGLPGTQTPV
jgi:hypothetical protein